MPEEGSNTEGGMKWGLWLRVGQNTMACLPDTLETHMEGVVDGQVEGERG